MDKIRLPVLLEDDEEDMSLNQADLSLFMADISVIDRSHSSDIGAGLQSSSFVNQYNIDFEV